MTVDITCRILESVEDAYREESQRRVWVSPIVSLEPAQEEQGEASSQGVQPLRTGALLQRGHRGGAPVRRCVRARKKKKASEVLFKLMRTSQWRRSVGHNTTSAVSPLTGNLQHAETGELPKGRRARKERNRKKTAPALSRTSVHKTKKSLSYVVKGDR